MRNFMKNALLLVGAATIIVSGLFSLEHLTDRIVFTVLVPGFLFGLILICIAMNISRDGWRWFS